MKTLLIEFDQALTNDQLESVSLLNAVADRMYVRPGSARHLKVFYAGGISPGPDGAIVNVTVSQANTSTDARSVTLTFQLTGDTSKSATVRVTQKGTTPSITVSDSNVVFNADGSLA